MVPSLLSVARAAHVPVPVENDSKRNDTSFATFVSTYASTFDVSHQNTAIP